MAETACRVRADAGARGLNSAGLFGAVTRIPFRLAALSAGRATLRPEVTRAPLPCHAACALSRVFCGQLRKLRAAECHKGDIRNDGNERGTNRRGAGAHRRQPGTHCGRPLGGRFERHCRRVHDHRHGGHGHRARTRGRGPAGALRARRTGRNGPGRRTRNGSRPVVLTMRARPEEGRVSAPCQHAESCREATQGRFRPRLQASPARIGDKRHRGAGQSGTRGVGQRTEDVLP